MLYVSALFAFFCGSHTWLRRQPRQVYPCESVVQTFCLRFQVRCFGAKLGRSFPLRQRRSGGLFGLNAPMPPLQFLRDIIE